MNAANRSEEVGTRPLPETTPRRAPIQYRLPAREYSGNELDSSQTGTKSDEHGPVQEPIRQPADDDFGDVVIGASYAALTLFFTQALASILLANYLGARIELRFVWNIAPYLAIEVLRPEHVVTIISYATASAAAVTCVGVLQSLIRHRENELMLNGWACGLPMSGVLLGFQFLRHVNSPPLVDGWVLAQAASIVIASAVIVLGFKPIRRPSNPAGLESGSTQETGQPSTTKYSLKGQKS